MKSLVPSAAALASIGFLTACHVESKKSVDENGDVTLNASADGAVNFDLPFAKGQLKLPTSMMSHGQVDIDGVKLMPGSKITGFSVMAPEGKQSSVNIGFASPQPPADVKNYYTTGFAKQGAQTSVSDGQVSAVTKDGDQVAISIVADGAGSKGMIAIQDKD